MSTDSIKSQNPATKLKPFTRTHGMTGTPEYLSYKKAKARCQNRNTVGYHNYGGRGIQFKFLDFMELFNEVGLKPTPNHSLDRIDNDGHYEPGNVRWATRKEQNNNQRPRMRRSSPCGCTHTCGLPGRL